VKRALVWETRHRLNRKDHPWDTLDEEGGVYSNHVRVPALSPVQINFPFLGSETILRQEGKSGKNEHP